MKVTLRSSPEGQEARAGSGLPYVKAEDIDTAEEVVQVSTSFRKPDIKEALARYGTVPKGSIGYKRDRYTASWFKWFLGGLRLKLAPRTGYSSCYTMLLRVQVCFVCVRASVSIAASNTKET